MAMPPPVLLLLALMGRTAAQYEQYSFRSFPRGDIVPLESAYSHGLEQYAAHRWRDSLQYLELSLRLYRLLRDSHAQCGLRCRDAGSGQAGHGDLRLLGHLLRRAACLRQCKRELPVFNVTQPRRELLDTFDRRIPYRYIQYAHYQLNNLEKAVSAAHTFLQKNPNDTLIKKNLDYYRTLFDVEEYLTDHEEQPYEEMFLKAVKLFNSGDFSSSARDMEMAVEEYFKAYELCMLGCEGSYEVTAFKDFFNSLADMYSEVLRCKMKCEANLTPTVGGFIVEKFVATMYHYLQFAYYKLNDVRNAAPCAASYMLFDSKDEVMKQNMVYYRFYREQWGLEESHFQPRPEALKYFNQTTMLREMLEFSEKYLQTDDEDVVSPEEISTSPKDPPDAEFEGLGDYEESFFAEWWQEPKTKGDTGESN